MSSKFDINDFNDIKVWDYICSGRTKGMFQLESNLGRHWSKQLQPKSISELSALISLIRPGCLRAYVDGKSMTQHYCDRKAGKDKVVYQHESLEGILIFYWFKVFACCWWSNVMKIYVI